MGHIHPSAVIEDGARLADDVAIGPFCHVGPKVSLGPGTRLISHVVVTGRTAMGRNNTVWPFSVIGGMPQDLKYQGEDSELVIGDHNEIRESVTIHLGTANDQGVTRLGDHNLLLVGAHVAHDCIIGSHCVLANDVLLAGHVTLEDYASIGGGAAVHHFVTVGRYAYVGGMTRLVRDAPPFMLIEGNPARVRKVNTVLLQRHHFPDEQVEHLKRAFKMLYRGEDNGESVGRTAESLHELDSQFPNDPLIQHLTQYVRRSTAGVYGRARETGRRDSPFRNPVR